MDGQSNIAIALNNVTYEHIPGVGVYDLNFSVPTGSIFGLIGPSGSGKTTSVRVMLGLLRPQKGEAFLLGEPTTRLHGKTRERVGYLPQHFVLYPDLSVVENLRFASSVYGVGYLRRRKLIENVLETVELSDARRRLAKDLSGGMQRRLALAASLLHRPELVFADEPTSGIDPVLRASLWKYLREYRDAGNTLMVTTQYVGEAAYCDMVGVMSEGRLLHVDTPQNLYRTALGGEIITVTVAPEQVYPLMRLLRQDERIKAIKNAPGEFGTLQLTVDNAGEMIPQVMEMVSAQPDLAVQQINRYEPPFDEIFADLVRQEKVEAIA
jgi:ABC-2 type transport system ATP-binding protein